MITGRITSFREAVLRLIILRSPGAESGIDAVMDTGFNGHVTLDAADIARLGLPFHSFADCMLADGSVVTVPRYRAAVMWHDRERNVMVLEGNGGALVGMSLLYGSRVAFDARDDGPLTIELLA